MIILVIFIPLFVSLLFYLVPAYLARQKRVTNPTEQYVSSRRTQSSIFTNAAVAYALQMATFGPFFVWGASGDYWPAIINSVFFGFGVWVLYRCRRPILDFISISLAGQDSISLHGFMAQAHGNSHTVRVATSVLTVVALWGIVIAEMFGAMAIISPMLNGNRELSFLLVAMMFFFMFLYTTAGGNEGVQRSDQFQLGVAYFCLFAILTAFLIAIINKASIPGDMFVPAALSFACLSLLFVRRKFRFIDYSVRSIADLELVDDHRMQVISRLYGWMERSLNWLVVAGVLSAGLACGIVLVRIATSVSPTAWFTPLLHPSGSSIISLIALALLPITYEVCDLSNWQRLAALRVDLATSAERAEVKASTERGLRGYALEGPTTWIILMLLGAVVAIAVGGLNAADPVTEFVQYLMIGGVWGWALLTLLVLAAFAIALSTMDAVLSATLFAFRYDIIYDRKKDSADDLQEAVRTKKVNRFGLVTYAIVVLGLFIAQQYLHAFGSEQYIVILLAIYSAQISFLPLILGGIAARHNREGFWNAGSGGAIAVLVAGFGSALATTAFGMWSNNSDAQWLAIPACLFWSTTTYFAACGARSVSRSPKFVSWLRGR